MLKQQLELIFHSILPLKNKNKGVIRFYKPLFFPVSQFIPGCKCTYTFTYEQKQQKTVSYRLEKQEVRFYGPVNQRAELRKGMRKFLIDQAKLRLLPIIHSKSTKTGLHYKKIRFKNQKSMWGSCSDLQNINFNIRLLFLPDELTEYVIIHELCHLVHLNHSKQFWNLVGIHCKDFRQKEKQLNQASKYIPKWIYRL